MMPPSPPGYERSAVAGTTIEDLDQAMLAAFLQRRAPKLAAVSPEQLAERLGLVTACGSRTTPTVAGLIGFASLPQLYRPEWGVAAVRVKGTQIADAIVQRLDLEGPLHALVEQSIDFVQQHSATIAQERDAQGPSGPLERDAQGPSGPLERDVQGPSGPLERDVQSDSGPPLDYPEAAVKEAILNALIHRDYRLSGRTTIKIFDDRLEVWSPGGLPAQFSIDNVTEAGGISLPRNPVIAAMARVMGLVEQVGRGLPTIRRALAELTSQQCVMRSTTNDFLVSLPCYRSPAAIPSGPAN